MELTEIIRAFRCAAVNSPYTGFRHLIHYYVHAIVFIGEQNDIPGFADEQVSTANEFHSGDTRASEGANYYGRKTHGKFNRA